MLHSVRQQEDVLAADRQVGRGVIENKGLDSVFDSNISAGRRRCVFQEDKVRQAGLMFRSATTRT